MYQQNIHSINIFPLETFKELLLVLINFNVCSCNDISRFIELETMKQWHTHEFCFSQIAYFVKKKKRLFPIEILCVTYIIGLFEVFLYPRPLHQICFYIGLAWVQNASFVFFHYKIGKRCRASGIFRAFILISYVKSCHSCQVRPWFSVTSARDDAFLAD